METKQTIFPLFQKNALFRIDLHSEIRCPARRKSFLQFDVAGLSAGKVDNSM